MKTFNENTRFGRLTIIKRTGLDETSKYYKPMVLCLCDCGKEIIKNLYDITSGHTKSCGCLRDEGRKPIHGMTKSPEWNTWCHIKQRCYDKNAKDFKRYGGRGIKMCDKWLNSFEAFFSDMGHRPFPNYTIERINNNGNYEPKNCAWIHHDKQALNRRNNTIIYYNGQYLTIGEWNTKMGFPHGLISQRLNKLGWSVNKSLSTPHRKRLI